MRAGRLAGKIYFESFALDYSTTVLDVFIVYEGAQSCLGWITCFIKFSTPDIAFLAF